MDFELEKKIWTEADFENMGWHDCQIYKIRITEDLELDLDYILKWNKPDIDGLPFTFWVAPATLVFKNIEGIYFEFDIGFEDSFEIEDIDSADNGWTIRTHKGEIRFSSKGFEQFIRQEPTFQFGQTIPYIERFGYSIERTTNQVNPNRDRDDIVEHRKKNMELYECAKKKTPKEARIRTAYKFKK